MKLHYKKIDINNNDADSNTVDINDNKNTIDLNNNETDLNNIDLNETKEINYICENYQLILHKVIIKLLM